MKYKLSHIVDQKIYNNRKEVEAVRGSKMIDLRIGWFLQGTNNKELSRDLKMYFKERALSF
jgi:hypothetical protein